MTQSKDMPKEIYIDANDESNRAGNWHVENIHPTKYIRADLVPHWQTIDTAPKDGTKIDLYCKLVYDYGDVKHKRYIDAEWGDLVNTLTGDLYQGWRIQSAPAYIVIAEEDLGILEVKVSQAILRDYKPIGGVMFDGENYLQACFKDNHSQ